MTLHSTDYNRNRGFNVTWRTLKQLSCDSIVEVSLETAAPPNMATLTANERRRPGHCPHKVGLILVAFEHHTKDRGTLVETDLF